MDENYIQRTVQTSSSDDFRTGLEIIFDQLPDAVGVYTFPDMDVLFTNLPMRKLDQALRSLAEDYAQGIPLEHDQEIRKFFKIKTQSGGYPFSELHEVSFKFLKADRDKKTNLLIRIKEGPDPMLSEADMAIKKLEEELNQAKQKLIHTEDKMGLALFSSGLGTWTINLSDNTVFWDQRTRELFGFPEKEIVPYNEVLRYIHESDRKRVDQTVKLAQLPGSDGMFDIKYRTIGVLDGRERWVHAVGRTYFDQAGTPAVFSGMLQDITQAMLDQLTIDNYNQIIAGKKRKLQLLVESAQVGTLTYDPFTGEIVLGEQSVVLFSKTAYGHDAQQYTDFNVARFLESCREAIVKAIENDRQCEYIYKIEGRAGTAEKWLRLTGRSMKKVDGEKNMFYGLIIDITKQKLEEQQKLDFLNISGHELRTPMTSLSGYLQLLSRSMERLDKGPMQKILDRALRQSERIGTLIESFLDLVKLETEELIINMVRCTMGELAENFKKHSADIASHRIVFDCYVEEVRLFCDLQKISKVYADILDNAIKFSPQLSTITVTIKAADAAVRISVSDEGPGVEIYERQHIFEKFYRGHRGRKDYISGFGIGLYLSKKIINMHKGDIGLESGEECGSRFWFSLPLLKDNPQ